MSFNPEQVFVLPAISMGVLQRRLCFAHAAHSAERLYQLTFVEIFMKPIQEVFASGKEFVAGEGKFENLRTLLSILELGGGNDFIHEVVRFFVNKRLPVKRFRVSVIDRFHLSFFVKWTSLLVGFTRRMGKQTLDLL